VSAGAKRVGRALRAGLVAAALWLPASPGAALAQGDTTAARPAAIPPGTPGAVRYGKWMAAALAVGTTVIGIREHNAGNDAYAALVHYCSQAITCTIATDGRYADATAEATYQQVVRDDRSARAWLVGGQVAAVGTAVLFVLELSHAGGPPNIPFGGLFVEPGPRQSRVGFRVPLGW